MENNFDGRIRVRVSLILQMVDDLTGQKIPTASLRVRAEGEQKPICKKEGYFIFTNLKSDKVTVYIQSPEYQTVRRVILLSELNPLEPFVRLRLHPGKCYSHISGATILTGRIAPNVWLQAASADNSHYLRLLYNYELKQKIISVYNPAQENLEGRSYLMWQKTFRKFEIAALKQAQDLTREVYELEHVLKKEYQKAATKLLPVSAVEADDNGEVYLFMTGLIGQKTDIICKWSQEGDNIERTYTVTVGKENKVEF